MGFGRFRLNCSERLWVTKESLGGRQKGRKGRQVFFVVVADRGVGEGLTCRKTAFFVRATGGGGAFSFFVSTE